MNCWELMKCPENVYKKCPAYPNRGKECWKVTGTKCEKGAVEKKNLSEKIEYCRTCEFFIKYAHKF